MNLEILRAIVIGLVIFLLIREVLTWYWKINRVVNVLEDIAVSLRTLPSVKAYDAYFDRKPRKAA